MVSRLSVHFRGADLMHTYIIGAQSTAGSAYTLQLEFESIRVRDNMH